MTILEKVCKETGKDSSDILCIDCPSDYGYDSAEACDDGFDFDCRTCWKRKCVEDKSIQDSGERTEFTTGAVRDMHTGKGRNDLLPLNAIMELSKHCEDGAVKYGEHNVEKGIPYHSFFDSAMRHLCKWALSWNDEDHLRAAAWNVMWLLEQRVTHPEMDDMYYHKADDEWEDIDE